MQLDYLLFDTSDEEGGACSFDAMASVLPARLAPLLGEVGAVLGWAHREFGPPSAATDDGDWTFELQAAGEGGVPLAIDIDLEGARVSMAHVPQGLVTLALTLGGTRAFGDAFRDAFPESD